MARNTPILAVVGRPNVGKSTLFNRIVGKRQAIIDDEPWVTRDRNYALVEDHLFPFILVDTGGFEQTPRDDLQQKIVEQTLLAVEEADLVLAVFDGSVGAQAGDDEVVDLLRRQQKPAIYAVNKCDGVEQEHRITDFYRFGIGELRGISALHNRGIAELITGALQTLPDFDRLHQAALREVEESAEKEELAREELALIPEPDEECEELPTDTEPEAPEPSFPPVHLPGDSTQSALEYDRAFKLRFGPATYKSADEEFDPAEFADLAQSETDELPQLAQIRVAIVGRPNVGKSTLLNRLVGSERAIASDVPGTTRDSLDVRLRREGQDFVFVDTAGLRKQARIADRLEKYSTMRTLRSLSECDVALVLLDASAGPTEQDAKIVGLAHEHGRAIVLGVNKWDLIEKDHRSVTEFKTNVREAFKFAPYSPILFISAQSGRRCPKIFETVKEVALEREKRVSTQRLNAVLQRAVTRVTAPSYRGRPIKLYYAAQVGTAPPRVVLFFNQPKGLHFSYLRYLKNVIREEFGFNGSDIKLLVRKR